jgi:hypothetical protein
MTEMAGLPPLHARWLADVVDGPIPDETEATCEHCVMVVHASTARSGFRADTKCCTYLPRLHNFLVGAVLADPDPAAATGRASVVDRIARRVAVTPLGLGRPRSYLLLYEDGGSVVFGRARAMRCPHYLEDSGRCGVWRHREATCATWFCKHVRGGVGASFWQEVRRMLATVERDLAWWCLGQIGIDIGVLAALLEVREADDRRDRKVSPGEIDGAEPRNYRELWGAWLDREHELYRACAELVAGLRWSQVVQIAGPVADAAARVVRDRHAQLISNRLPDRLVAGTFRTLGFSGGNCLVAAYSDYDPVALPVALVEALPSFDGRPLDAVLADLAANGIELERDLVLRLLDLGVLVPPES